MARTPTGTRHTAAAQFFAAVRLFAQRQPEWADCIVYDVQPGDEWNLPLVSNRVYGNRDETLTIQAAAGLDSVEQPLTPRRLVLPTATQLRAIKAKCGLITNALQRQPGAVDNPLSQG